MQAIPTSRLRPLGLGEVLDRAVTLSVKHGPILVMIAVVFMVPLGIAQFFGFADQTKMYGALADVLQSGSSGKPVSDSAVQQMFGPSLFNGWTALWILLYVFVAPLSSGALVAGAAAFYLGGTTSLGQAYSLAVRQWGHLLLLNVMFLFVAGIAETVFVLLALILGFGLFALATPARPLAIGLAIVFGIALLLLLIVAVLIGTLTWQMSFVDCIVERSNFIAAFASGFRRVFAGVGLRRSLVVGLAYFAITIGVALVGALGGGVLYGVVRSHVLGEAFTTLVALATAAFTTTFMTIFYYDLRVREEGFDLQLPASADALTTA